jgi:hypothetical protein
VAKTLNLKRNYTSWSNEEEYLLERLYNKEYKNVKDIQNEFPNRSLSSLYNRINVLGLNREFSLGFKEPPKITQAELGYFAGNFDGEGTIGLYLRPSKNSYGVNIRVSLLCKSVIEKYYNTFGGRFFQINRLTASDSIMWQWNMSNIQGGRYFLSLISPHLIEKQEQAYLMLEWIDWRIGKSYHHAFSDSDMEYSKGISMKLQELKRLNGKP